MGGAKPQQKRLQDVCGGLKQQPQEKADARPTDSASEARTEHSLWKETASALCLGPWRAMRHHLTPGHHPAPHQGRSPSSRPHA